jgi:hypothetical protein
MMEILNRFRKSLKWEMENADEMQQKAKHAPEKVHRCMDLSAL